MALRTIPPRVPARDSRTVKPAKKRAAEFYATPAWRALVTSLIAQRGRRCEACSRTTNPDGSPVRLFGDHVQELRDGGAPLDPANVQLLDGSCHAAKTIRARVARLRS